ncbi:glycoside hydrolase family 76 protein [Xylariaceae sp. FL1019]|nr:glycoside hydrolase family 76 protein [Xylariaceae sp. FL1019]
MKSSSIQGLAATLTLAQAAQAVTLNTASTTSIKEAAKTISKNLFAFHNANATTGQFNQPEAWFWWRSGAAWTALMDYQHYTNDTTYSAALVSSLKTNLGPNYDFADASQSGWEANDDQAYWLYNALTGMEYGFDPIDATHSWEQIAQNVFAEYVSRWNHDETTCNGGLKWQYNPSLNGYTYKNTVSNSGFFQTAARLARYTGNSTYADWATKIWDWSVGIGFVTAEYHVYDGAGEDQDCTVIDKSEWSYNIASYMHGAAHMYNYTDTYNHTEAGVWEDRVAGLVKTANETFFKNGIMFEQKCEPDMSCSVDNTGFKSSLARWMGKTAVLVPTQKETIMGLLETSALGAAKSCAGTGNACGIQWTTGSFDGNSDFGTTLSAFEVIQSLLVFDGAAPLTANSTVAADSGSKTTDEDESSETSAPVKKSCARRRS